MIISKYGIHCAGGVPFLVQGSGTQNLISGDLKAPFKLRIRPRTLICPHEIDLNLPPVDLPSWLEDPLAQALLPTPQDGMAPAAAIVDHDGSIEHLALQLLQMSSLTAPAILPLWFRRAAAFLNDYSVTNITPMVWTRVTMRESTSVQRHVDMAAALNRRVLFIFRQQVPIFSGIKWITTDLRDLSSEPLSQIGSQLIRDAMNAR